MQKSTLISIALVLFAAVSCTREQPVTDTMAHASEAYIPAQEGVCFTATLEDTRTYRSDTKVLWNQGDAVKIFWDGGSVTATASRSGSTTDFVASVDPEASAWYAVYPGSLTASYSDANGLSVTIPAIQSGLFEEADVLVSRTTGTNFAFKHLCGLMRFRIENSDVRTLIIRSLNNDVALAGTLPVSFNGSGETVPGEASSTSTSITLSITGPGTYYAAFLPGANMTKGFYIELQDASGNLIPGVIGTNALTMNRSQVQTLGILDDQMRFDWFVTPDGAGTQDGSSWENALSWAEFLGWVNNSTTTYPLAAKIARISGSTFNFKEGTYQASGQSTLQYTDFGKPVPLTLVGGYAASLTGTDKSSRTPRSTVFSPAENGVFRLFYVRNWAKLSMDGITFRGFSCSDTGHGGAVAYVQPASTDQKPAFICNNCLFENNVSSGNSGGSLYIENGNLRLTGCDFKNGQAGSDYAGAVFIRDDSSMSVENCSFTDNHAPVAGGAVYVEKVTSDVVISACAFTGNYTTSDNQWANYGGGAVCVRADAVDAVGTVLFDACTFKGNYSASFGGAVMFRETGSTINSMKVYARGCRFEDNYSNYFGGAWSGSGRLWAAGYAANLYRSFFDACIFTGNYVKKSNGNCTGHAIGFNQGWLALNNCALYDNGTASGAASAYSSDIAFEANKDNYTGCKSVVLMTNTTIVSPANAVAAIRVRMSDAYINLANCLIVSPANAVQLGTDKGDSRDAVFASPTAGQYNVLSFDSETPAAAKNYYKTYCNGNHSQAVALADYSTWKSKFTDGYKFDKTGLNLDAYVTSAATLSDFCTPVNVTYDLGGEFKTFVGGNFGKDISGATRSGNFTPGCRQ